MEEMLQVLKSSNNNGMHTCQKGLYKTLLISHSATTTQIFDYDELLSLFLVYL